MKKIIVFIIATFILLLNNSSYSEIISDNNDPKVYKTIIFKNGEKNANDILLKYVKDNLTNYEWNTLNVFKLQAYSIDLNGDNEKEIVGIVTSMAHCNYSYNNCGLFILQKQNGEYKNLSMAIVDTYPVLKILKQKHNNYYDIQVSDYKPGVLQNVLTFQKQTGHYEFGYLIKN